MSDTVVESIQESKNIELNLKKLKVGIVRLTKEEHPSANTLYVINHTSKGQMMKKKYHFTVENRLNRLKEHLKTYHSIRLHLLIIDRGNNYKQMIILLSEFSDNNYSMDLLQQRLALTVKILKSTQYSVKRTRDWISFDLDNIPDNLLDYSVEFGLHETSWIIELLQIFEPKIYSGYQSEFMTKRYMPVVEGRNPMGRDIHGKLVGANLDNLLYSGQEKHLGQIASKLGGCIILTDNPGLYRIKSHKVEDITMSFIDLYGSKKNLGFLIMRYWQMLVRGGDRDPSYFDEIVKQIMDQGFMDDVSLSDFLAEGNSFSVWNELSTDSNRIHFMSKYVEIFESGNYNSVSKQFDEIRQGNHTIDISGMSFLDLAAFSIMLMVLKEAGLIRSWLVLPNFESRLDYSSIYKINSIMDHIDTREIIFYTKSPVSNKWRSEFGNLILDSAILGEKQLRFYGVDYLRKDGLILLSHNNRATVLQLEDYKFVDSKRIELPSIYNRAFEDDEAVPEEEEEIDEILVEPQIQRDDYSILVYLNHSYETVPLEHMMDELLLGEIDQELIYLKSNNLIIQFDDALMISNAGRKIVRQMIENLKMSEETSSSEKGDHYLITDLRVRLNECTTLDCMMETLTDIVLLARKLEADGMKPLFSKLMGILANLYNDKTIDILSIPPDVGYYLKILQEMVSETDLDILDELEISEEDLEEEIEVHEEPLSLPDVEDHPWQRMSSDEYLKNTMIKQLTTELDKDILRAYMRIRAASIAQSISRDYLVENKLASEEQIATLIDARLIDSYNNTVDINEVDEQLLDEIENRLGITPIPTVAPKPQGFRNIDESELANIPLPAGAKIEEEKPEPTELILSGSKVLETREELEGIYRILCEYHLSNSITSTDEMGIANAKSKGLIVGNGSLDLTNKGREIIIKEILPIVNGVQVDLAAMKVDEYSLGDLGEIIPDILVHLMGTDNIGMIASALSLNKTLDRYKGRKIEDDDGSFIIQVRQSVQSYLSWIVSRMPEETRKETEEIEVKEKEKVNDLKTESTSDEVKEEIVKDVQEKPRGQEKRIEIDTVKLGNLKGISPRIALSMAENKFFTIYDIATMFNPIEELVDVKYIGIKTANKIIDLINKIKLASNPAELMREPVKQVKKKEKKPDVLGFDEEQLDRLDNTLNDLLQSSPEIMIGDLIRFIIREVTGKTVDIEFKELISRFNKAGSVAGIKTTDLTSNYTNIRGAWTSEKVVRDDLMIMLKDRFMSIMYKFNHNQEFIDELKKLNKLKKRAKNERKRVAA